MSRPTIERYAHESSTMRGRGAGLNAADALPTVFIRVDDGVVTEVVATTDMDIQVIAVDSSGYAADTLDQHLPTLVVREEMNAIIDAARMEVGE